MNPGHHETYKGACLFSLSSQGALLVQYTPYGQALFVELHEPSYYCITSLILLNFYKPKKLPCALPAAKKKGTGQFFRSILPDSMEPGPKESGFVKIQFVFFHKIYYNKM